MIVKVKVKVKVMYPGDGGTVLDDGKGLRVEMFGLADAQLFVHGRV